MTLLHSLDCENHSLLILLLSCKFPCHTAAISVQCAFIFAVASNQPVTSSVLPVANYSSASRVTPLPGFRCIRWQCVRFSPPLCPSGVRWGRAVPSNFPSGRPPPRPPCGEVTAVWWAFFCLVDSTRASSRLALLHLFSANEFNDGFSLCLPLTCPFNSHFVISRVAFLFPSFSLSFPPFLFPSSFFPQSPPPSLCSTRLSPEF